MLLFFAALCIAALALALTVARAARVRRLLEESRSVVRMGEFEASVPEMLWHLRSLGGGPSVHELPRRATTSQELADAIEEYTSSLPPEQRSDLQARYLSRERVAHEESVTAAQLSVLPQAAAVGALDGALIAVGNQHEQIAQWFTEAASGVGVTEVSSLVGAIAAATPRVAAPDVVSQWVENSAAEVVAAVLNGDAAAAVAETAVEGMDSLAGVLDSGVPFASIGLAMHRAVQQKRAGLDDGRVGENFALDVGVKGSSVALGAAAGSMVFPVVGTVIGGLLGGLLGGEVARAAKERHVRRAHDDLLESVEGLGNEVMRSSWVTLADERRADLQTKVKVHTTVTAELKRMSRWRKFRPDLVLVAHRLALEVGSVDIGLSAEEQESFMSLLQDTGSADEAWMRGSMLLARPDLIARFEIHETSLKAATSALDRLGEERHKLALA